jgi:hypothetical protein
MRQSWFREKSANQVSNGLSPFLFPVSTVSGSRALSQTKPVPPKLLQLLCLPILIIICFTGWAMLVVGERKDNSKRVKKKR